MSRNRGEIVATEEENRETLGRWWKEMLPKDPRHAELLRNMHGIEEGLAQALGMGAITEDDAAAIRKERERLLKMSPAEVRRYARVKR